MANKFILWCEDVNNTQDYTSFSTDSQREEGFKGSTAASAIRVNTALRQSSLVSAALMNALMPDNQTLTYRNDLTTVTNAINTSLTERIKTTKVDNASQADDSLHADNADNSTNATNVVSLQNNTKVPLTINSNNQLTVNDEIIVRKKLVWEGYLSADTVEGVAIDLPFAIANNDLYEVEMQVPLTGYSEGFKVQVKIGSSVKVGCGNGSGVLFVNINDDTNGVWLFSTLIEIRDHVDHEIRLYPARASLINAKTMSSISSKFNDQALVSSITKIYKIIE